MSLTDYRDRASVMIWVVLMGLAAQRFLVSRTRTHVRNLRLADLADHYRQHDPGRPPDRAGRDRDRGRGARASQRRAAGRRPRRREYASSATPAFGRRSFLCYYRPCYALCLTVQGLTSGNPACSLSSATRRRLLRGISADAVTPELLNQIGVALELIVAGISCAHCRFLDRHGRLGVPRYPAAHPRYLRLGPRRPVRAGPGPIGVILYLFLRPKETLAEVYDRQLEEEAFLRDISLRRACPGCQAVTEPDWLVCPHCRTELRRLCESCGRPLGSELGTCPYCCTAPQATRASGRSRPRSPPTRHSLSRWSRPRPAMVGACRG